MKKSWKKMLSVVLTLSMVLALLPVTALAEGEAEEAMCTCTALCTEETVNMECAVCGTGGACGFVVPVDATAPAEETTPVETETPAEEPPAETETPAEEPVPAAPETPAESIETTPAEIEAHAEETPVETPAEHAHVYGAWDYDADNDSFFRVCDADDETETSEMPDEVAKLAEDVQAAADLEEAEAIVGKAVEDGAIGNFAAAYLMNLVGAYEVETQADAEAQIGDTTYTTLASAISKVGKNGTVVLKKDVTAGDIPLDMMKNFTLDLGGHTLTVSAPKRGYAFNTSNGAKMTVINGTIDYSNPTGVMSVFNWSGGALTLGGGDKPLTINVGENGFGVIASSSAKVIIESNATITSPYCCVFLKQGGKQTVDVFGTLTATGTGRALEGNGNSTSSNSSSITIHEGADISAENQVAIFHPQKGTLTVEGGTITGQPAIYLRSGHLNVTGGIINGEGTEDF